SEARSEAPVVDIEKALRGVARDIEKRHHAGRSRYRIDLGGVEAIAPRVLFGDRRIDIPAQAQVQCQIGGYFKVILNIGSNVVIVPGKWRPHAPPGAGAPPPAGRGGTSSRPHPPP